MKLDFSSESFKRKFIASFFRYKLMNGCSKKNREHYPKKALNKGMNKPGLKFNLGLVLIDL